MARQTNRQRQDVRHATKDQPQRKLSKKEQKQAREKRFRENPIDTDLPPSEVSTVKTLTREKAAKALRKMGYSKAEAEAAAAAIDRYTYILDKPIREAQRDYEAAVAKYGEGVAREALHHAKNLEAMMRRDPAPRDTLYRGFRDTRSRMFDGLEVGDVFQVDSALASTSRSRSAAEGFAVGDQSVLLEISGGVPASLAVGKMGNFDVEDEVLIPSRTRARVVSMDRTTGRIRVEHTTDPITKDGVMLRAMMSRMLARLAMSEPNQKPSQITHPWRNSESPYEDEVVTHPITGKRVKVRDLTDEVEHPLSGEPITLRDVYLQRQWNRGEP